MQRRHVLDACGLAPLPEFLAFRLVPIQGVSCNPFRPMKHHLAPPRLFLFAASEGGIWHDPTALRDTVELPDNEREGGYDAALGVKEGGDYSLRGRVGFQR